jgi:UDPglucose--hexose-1-phosphate uridylyltransferase
VVAPTRAHRPGAPRAGEVVEEDDPVGCPFDEGRESATPPETFAIAPPGRPPDTPGWRVRVVPNKFPAFGPWPRDGDRPEGLFAHLAAVGRQEVVVHSPRHVRSFADLSSRELELVAEAWQARAGVAREAGFPYVHALVNEGGGAGASLAHSHSQLVWLENDPPLVAQELALQEEAETCVVCRVLAEEREQRIRVVRERDGLILLCPYAGRQPYELLAAPLEHETDAFTSRSLGAALILVSEGIRRLRIAEGPVPFNLWLHAAGHWHIEVLPRFGVLAGVELGAGYFVNTMAPESAAGVLRES